MSTSAKAKAVKNTTMLNHAGDCRGAQPRFMKYHFLKRRKWVGHFVDGKIDCINQNQLNLLE